MSALIAPVTAEYTTRLVAELRQIANHIENNGPAVILSGGLAVSLERDVAEWRSFGEHVGHVVKATTISVFCDLVLSGNMDAPDLGLKLRRATDGTIVRWDGKPQHAPRRGEYYMYPDDEDRQVFRATSHHMKAKWVMEEAS